MKWKYSHINHLVRLAMGLTLEEYAVFDLIYRAQVHPSTSKGGYTDTSYRQIGEALGIGKTTAYEIIMRGVEWKVIEFDPNSVRRKATTELWYDYPYLQDEEALAQLQIPCFRSKSERSESERQSSATERNRSSNGQLSKEVSESLSIDAEDPIFRQWTLVVSHFKDYPDTPKAILGDAMRKMKSDEFYTELKAWLRWHAHNTMIKNNPVKYLRGGRSNFTSWLKSDRNTNKRKRTPDTPTVYDEKV